jgi:hypothetical protein
VRRAPYDTGEAKPMEIPENRKDFTFFPAFAGKDGAPLFSST